MEGEQYVRNHADADADAYPYPDADADADADTNQLEEAGASRVYARKLCKRLGLYPYG